MRTGLLLVLTASLTGSSFAESVQGPLCRSFAGRSALALAHHLYLDERRAREPSFLRGLPSTVDVSADLVLIADNGRIVARPNPFDLAARSIRFTPADGFRRYRVRSAGTPFQPALGARRPIGDDQSQSIELSFEFPFFGERYTRVFLNSDGNVTFQRGDSASTERSLDRFLTGAPRIALFFDDLDPTGGGEVRVSNGPDRLVVTWDRVPEWNETNENTFQLVLLPAGVIEMRYGRTVAAKSAVIGIAPGSDTGGVVLTDLSETEKESGGALAEWFAASAAVDDVALTKRFYQSFPDLYDGIVVWTNFDTDLDDTFAFHINVQNEVAGIGERVFDDTATWGSEGQLSSFIFMSNIDQYPASPDQRVRGAAARPTTLGLLAHEVGHRWLASPRVMRTGLPANVLLGRANVHWSFFFNSDASFLEGNAIIEEAPGTFRTTEIVSRYSRLGLYLMGMAPAAEVAPFFVVTDPNGSNPFVENDSPPRIGVTFRGVRTDLNIDDVQAALGPRRPGFEAAPKEFRYAFVLLHRGSQPPSADAITKIQDARNAWERFFTQHTLGRGHIVTAIER